MYLRVLVRLVGQVAADKERPFAAFQRPTQIHVEKAHVLGRTRDAVASDRTEQRIVTGCRIVRVRELVAGRAVDEVVVSRIEQHTLVLIETRRELGIRIRIVECNRQALDANRAVEELGFQAVDIGITRVYRCRCRVGAAAGILRKLVTIDLVKEQ